MYTPHRSGLCAEVREPTRTAVHRNAGCGRTPHPNHNVLFVRAACWQWDNRHACSVRGRRARNRPSTWGAEPEDRPVLALATASRHPGIAIAIAQTNFPQQKLAMTAVILYLLVNAIVAIPYLRWIKRTSDISKPAAERQPIRSNT